MVAKREQEFEGSGEDFVARRAQILPFPTQLQPTTPLVESKPYTEPTVGQHTGRERKPLYYPSRTRSLIMGTDAIILPPGKVSEALAPHAPVFYPAEKSRSSSGPGQDLVRARVNR